MKLFIIYFWIHACLIITFGQNASCQINDYGKNKAITVFLNESWKVVENNKDASFLRYEYLIDDKFFPQEIYYSDNYEIKFDTNSQITTPDGIIILSGEYKWYDKHGRLLSHEKYQNGFRVWTKSYRWGFFNRKLTGKKIHEYFDYSKMYENQPGTFYKELFDKKGNKSMWFLRNGEKGIKFYSTS